MRIVSMGEVATYGEKFIDATDGCDHLVVMSENGIIRWKADPAINELWELDLLNMDSITDADLVGDRQDVYKKLYRDLGWPLSEYIALFDETDPIHQDLSIKLH